MEVAEAVAKVDDLFGHHHNPMSQTVNSEVKLEPHEEDLKHLDTALKSEPDEGVPTSASVWSFLAKRSRYLHQVENGPQMNQLKLTKTLLLEMQKLLNEVSGFVRACCDPCYPEQHLHDLHHPPHEDLIVLDDHLAQAVMLEKGTNLRIISNPPSNYQEELFFPFSKDKDQLVSSNLIERYVKI